MLMLEKPPSNLACLLWSFGLLVCRISHHVASTIKGKMRTDSVAIDLTGSLFRRLCREFRLPDMCPRAFEG